MSDLEQINLSGYIIMNRLRTILDGIIVYIAFSGVAAFGWRPEPMFFFVMPQKGINTPLCGDDSGLILVVIYSKNRGKRTHCTSVSDLL